jgi:hypothetical protein
MQPSKAGESTMQAIMSRISVQDLERRPRPRALVVITAVGLFNITVTVLSLLSF